MTVNDLLKGARASQDDPQISQLLFADDCVLFEESSIDSARVLKDKLNMK